MWAKNEVDSSFDEPELQRKDRVGSQGIIPSSVQSLQTGNISGISQSVVVAPPGSKQFGNFNSIHEGIKFIEKKGGGTVFVKNGTYVLREDVILPSGINLIGESIGGVVISFAANNASVKVLGTDKYSTGTVSVTKGSNIVTGASTVWLTNLTLDHQLKIGKYVYSIKSIDTDTQVTLTSKVFDTTDSGLAYFSAKFKKNIQIQNIIIAAPLVNGLIMDHVDGFFVQNVIVSSAITSVGFDLDVLSRGGFNFVTADACGGTGYTLDSLTQVNFSFLVSTNNGNSGIAVTSCDHLGFEYPTLNNNASTGFLGTSLNRIAIRTGDVTGNGNHGLEFVSDCNYNQIYTGAYENNGADGLKFTATCDNNVVIGALSTGNTGKGMHIAANTCDNNIVSSSQLAGNTGASFTDSGTGTTDGGSNEV